MKQVLQQQGETVVLEVAAPRCPPGSVLVANGFSVISSGTERTRVEGGRQSLLARAIQRPDLVRDVASRALRDGVRATRVSVQRKLHQASEVGYSSAGRVIEVGPAVRGITPGDRVACAGAGYANHAEIVSVPANLCVLVPEDVSLEAASFSTIAAIALHGVRLARVEVGSRVAVVGCGLVGQLACQLLRAAGATVFAIDLDLSRAKFAQAGGADEAMSPDKAASRISRATEGVGVDAVLVTAASSTNAPLVLGAEVARDRATLIIVGDVPIDVPRAPLYNKELEVRVSRSYGPGRYDPEYEERGLDYPVGFVRWTVKRNMEAVLQLEARGDIRLRNLVEEIVPVDEAPRAYARLVAEDDRPLGALLLAYGEHVPSAERRVLQLDALEKDPVPRKAHGVAPIRIGLIGPGSFATRVLGPAFASAGAVLEAVAGGSAAAAQHAAKELGFNRVLDGADEVIADEQVDAVVICTRHGSHAALTQQALEAGKHVFCEKPLALSGEELDRVLRAAQGSAGILSVGFNRRFAPFMRELRAFVSESGPLTAIYRVSAGAIPGDHWVHDLEEGGGRAIGEGSHFVDSLRFLAGCDVIEVFSAGYGSPGSPLQARDNLAITLRFADGSIGTVVYVADGDSGLGKERLEVFCSQRSAVLDDFLRLELYGGEKRKSQTRPGKGHSEEVQEFMKGLLTGTPPVPLHELANVSLAAVAMVESLRTGEPIHLRGQRFAD
jgi:predicted dehydrogenase